MDSKKPEPTGHPRDDVSGGPGPEKLKRAGRGGGGAWLASRHSVGRGASAPVPAVVVGVDRAAGRRQAIHRAWKRSLPIFLFSLLLHGAAGWTIFTYLLPGPRADAEPSTLMASLEDSDDFEPPEVEPPLPEPEEPETLDISPPEVEVIVPEETLEADDRPSGMDLNLIGLGGSSSRGHGYRARSPSGWSIPEGLDAIGAGDSPFRGFLTDLRNRGLDVVFVIDATGSMQRFIDRARGAIDDIIQDLATVVPSLRIGLVAYRDLGDEWVTRYADLTTDRYYIHSFLQGLQARGGRRNLPDFEEAVEVGLDVATQQMSWRKGARRVILLVGDAPYHDEDRGAANAVVRSFARVSHSLVNTIYVSAGEFERPTENQMRARDAFQSIANLGGGTAFELPVEDPEADETLRLSVTVATFGDDWLDEIAALRRSAPADSRLSSVERHKARRDRKWLIHKISLQPIHPAVVLACRELFDGRIAAAMLKQLENESLDPPLRTAALYVLQSSLEAVQDIPFDAYKTIEEQKVALAEIRHHVRQVKGASALLDAKEVGNPPPSRPPGERSR
jgi:hypothetical protein